MMDPLLRNECAESPKKQRDTLWDDENDDVDVDEDANHHEAGLLPASAARSGTVANSGNKSDSIFDVVTMMDEDIRTNGSNHSNHSSTSHSVSNTNYSMEQDDLIQVLQPPAAVAQQPVDMYGSVNVDMYGSVDMHGSVNFYNNDNDLASMMKAPERPRATMSKQRISLSMPGIVHEEDNATMDGSQDGLDDSPRKKKKPMLPGGLMLSLDGSDHREGGGKNATVHDNDRDLDVSPRKKKPTLPGGLMLSLDGSDGDGDDDDLDGSKKKAKARAAIPGSLTLSLDSSDDNDMDSSRRRGVAGLSRPRVISQRGSSAPASLSLDDDLDSSSIHNRTSGTTSKSKKLNCSSLHQMSNRYATVVLDSSDSNSNLDDTFHQKRRSEAGGSPQAQNPKPKIVVDADDDDDDDSSDGFGGGDDDDDDDLIQLLDSSAGYKDPNNNDSQRSNRTSNTFATPTQRDPLDEDLDGGLDGSNHRHRSRNAPMQVDDDDDTEGSPGKTKKKNSMQGLHKVYHQGQPGQQQPFAGRASANHTSDDSSTTTAADAEYFLDSCDDDDSFNIGSSDEEDSMAQDDGAPLEEEDRDESMQQEDMLLSAHSQHVSSREPRDAVEHAVFQLEVALGDASKSMLRHQYGSSSDDDDDDSEDSDYQSFYDSVSSLSLDVNAWGPSSEDGEGSGRRVQFDSVEIREYAVTVGDHPCCTDYCPLTLEWEYTETLRQQVTHYDASRFIERLQTGHGGTNPRRLSLRERRQRILNVKGLWQEPNKNDDGEDEPDSPGAMSMMEDPYSVNSQYDERYEPVKRLEVHMELQAVQQNMKAVHKSLDRVHEELSQQILRGDHAQQKLRAKQQNDAAMQSVQQALQRVHTEMSKVATVAEAYVPPAPPVEVTNRWDQQQQDGGAAAATTSDTDNSDALESTVAAATPMIPPRRKKSGEIELNVMDTSLASATPLAPPQRKASMEIGKPAALTLPKRKPSADVSLVAAAAAADDAESTLTTTSTDTQTTLSSTINANATNQEEEPQVSLEDLQQLHESAANLTALAEGVPSTSSKSPLPAATGAEVHAALGQVHAEMEEAARKLFPRLDPAQRESVQKDLKQVHRELSGILKRQGSFRTLDKNMTQQQQEKSILALGEASGADLMRESSEDDSSSSDEQEAAEKAKWNAMSKVKRAVLQRGDSFKRKTGLDPKEMDSVREALSGVHQEMEAAPLILARRGRLKQAEMDRVRNALANVHQEIGSSRRSEQATAVRKALAGIHQEIGSSRRSEKATAVRKALAGIHQEIGSSRRSEQATAVRKALAGIHQEIGSSRRSEKATAVRNALAGIHQEIGSSRRSEKATAVRNALAGVHQEIGSSRRSKQATEVRKAMSPIHQELFLKKDGHPDKEKQHKRRLKRRSSMTENNKKMEAVQNALQRVHEEIGKSRHQWKGLDHRQMETVRAALHRVHSELESAPPVARHFAQQQPPPPQQSQLSQIHDEIQRKAPTKLSASRSKKAKRRPSDPHLNEALLRVHDELGKKGKDKRKGKSPRRSSSGSSSGSSSSKRSSLSSKQHREIVVYQEPQTDIVPYAPPEDPLAAFAAQQASKTDKLRRHRQRQFDYLALHNAVYTGLQRVHHDMEQIPRPFSDNYHFYSFDHVTYNRYLVQQQQPPSASMQLARVPQYAHLSYRQIVEAIILASQQQQQHTAPQSGGESGQQEGVDSSSLGRVEIISEGPLSRKEGDEQQRTDQDD